MKFLSFFALLVAFSLFSYSYLLKTDTHYRDEFHSNFNQIFEQLKKEHPSLNKYLSGASHISFNGYIEELIFILEVKELCNEQEALTLYRSVYSLFLDKTKQNPVTKSYIEKFPFGITNISIALYFKDSNGMPALQPYVGGIRSVKEGCTLHTFNPISQKPEFEVVDLQRLLENQGK